MSPADLAAWLDYASKAGVLGLLIVVLIGGFRRWWVWGWQYEEQVERTKAAESDRDEWKFLALTGTQTARQAVTSLASRK